MQHSMRAALGLLPLLHGSALGETFLATAGMTSLSAYGSNLENKQEISPSILMRFNHVVTPRWSVHGLLSSGTDGAFVGYGGGISYDFNHWRNIIEDESGRDRSYSILVMPSWHYRASLSLMKWRYSAVFRSTVRRVTGSNNVAINADLYGAMLGIGTTRFIDNSWGVTFDVSAFSGVANGLTGFGAQATIGASAWY